uniref:Tectonic-1 n=1 Tax=Denticeps clupeoides TaxID=299321 RepID=A0AAY4EDN6_9TELE
MRGRTAAFIPTPAATRLPPRTTPGPIRTCRMSPSRPGTRRLPSPHLLRLPPATLCPCDLQIGGCDANCCCDPDCAGELALFTSCSVQKVMYAPFFFKDGQSTLSSIQREVNPDVFCIQSANCKHIFIGTKNKMLVLPVNSRWRYRTGVFQLKISNCTLNSFFISLHTSYFLSFPKVWYTVIYSGVGEVLNMIAAVTLGTITSTMLPMQQYFQIEFKQENKLLMKFSGNPGYVVGLPLIAGSSTHKCKYRLRNGALSLLRRSQDQDCLAAPSQRTPVLFGIDMVSGCTLRLEDLANCTQVSEVLLGILKGQNFPEYVASFGNSLPQNPMDWVPIKNQTTPTVNDCSIPLTLHLEVRWTKFGSLVNPQAQIISGSFVSVTSSVAFIDVSAQADAGYKATPTIDAKLPFDFFFPFV